MILPKAKGVIPQKLEWDIYLTSVNDVKTDILNALGADPSRRAHLEAPMPKYIWRAVCQDEKHSLFECLFDATGLEQSDLCFRVREYDFLLGDLIRGVLRNPASRAKLEGERFWAILKKF